VWRVYQELSPTLEIPPYSEENYAVFQGSCPGGSSGFAAVERKFKISCCFPKGSASLFLLET
jgi:hypothetical protein